MNRLSILCALAVVGCFALAPTARATSPAPTTQPATEQTRVVTFRYRGNVITGALILNAPQSTTTSLSIPWNSPWPLVRGATPMQNPPAGWVLRNQNSNTWHYVIPMGAQ